MIGSVCAPLMVVTLAIAASMHDLTTRIHYNYVYNQLARGSREAIATLARDGTRHYNVYHKILTAHEPSWPTVVTVYLVLRQINADKSLFRDPTIALLNSSDLQLRRVAVGFLSDIGTHQDTPPVVALLWDKDPSIVYLAASTLSKIGTRQDLVAINIWLACRACVL